MKILIIGAGASGIMAANEASKKYNGSVFLFEKNNTIGRKVLISGGGRANVCTGFRDNDKILSSYPRGKKLIKYLLYEFSPQNLCEFFEKSGLKLKIEKDMRVFPVSDKSEDVIKVFENEFKKNNVKLFLGEGIKLISYENEKFNVVTDKNRNLIFDKVIITTGGKAYRETGSTGDGYHFAEKLGHKISKLSPSLNSLILKEKIFSELSGISFKDVKIYSGKTFEIGSFIFTHKGISGPLVFKISSLFAHSEISKNNPLSIFIDFFPNENEESLKEKIFSLASSKKQIKNILSEFLTKSFANIILKLLNIDPEKKINELSKKEVNKIIASLKSLNIHAIGRSSGEEFVTAGGISLDEIDIKTMESKIQKGLYFAGEILDVDGFTGGFNLYSAFATGYIAGKSV